MPEWYLMNYWASVWRADIDSDAILEFIPKFTPCDYWPVPYLLSYIWIYWSSWISSFCSWFFSLNILIEFIFLLLKNFLPLASGDNTSEDLWATGLVLYYYDSGLILGGGWSLSCEANSYCYLCIFLRKGVLPASPILAPSIMGVRKVVAPVWVLTIECPFSGLPLTCEIGLRCLPT